MLCGYEYSMVTNFVFMMHFPEIFARVVKLLSGLRILEEIYDTPNYLLCIYGEDVLTLLHDMNSINNVYFIIAYYEKFIFSKNTVATKQFQRGFDEGKPGTSLTPNILTKTNHNLVNIQTTFFKD